MPDGPAPVEAERSERVLFREVLDRTKKESAPNKIISELDERNERLQGRLKEEFGEGKAKFVALRSCLRSPDSQSEPGRRAFLDYLLITSEGYKILRVSDGTFMSRTDKDSGLSSAIEMLVTKGDPTWYRNYSDRLPDKAKYSTEGSGFTHEYVAGNELYKINFGKGPSIEFTTHPSIQGEASMKYPSGELMGYLKDAAKRGTYIPQQVEAISNLRGNEIRLILNPDQTEVSEIIDRSFDDAEFWIKREKEEKSAVKS